MDLLSTLNEFANQVYIPDIAFTETYTKTKHAKLLITIKSKTLNQFDSNQDSAIMLQEFLMSLLDKQVDFKIRLQRRTN